MDSVEKNCLARRSDSTFLVTDLVIYLESFQIMSVDVRQIMRNDLFPNRLV